MLPISLRVVTKMLLFLSLMISIGFVSKGLNMITRMFRLSLNSLPVWMGCLFPTVCW